MRVAQSSTAAVNAGTNTVPITDGTGSSRYWGHSSDTSDRYPCDLDFSWSCSASSGSAFRLGKWREAFIWYNSIFALPTLFKLGHIQCNDNALSDYSLGVIQEPS